MIDYYGRKTYSDIEDVEADTTHVLLAENTLLGRPLEGSNARILDLVEVLNTLSDINEQVGAGGVGTEAPNLPGVSDVPAELVSEETSTELVIVTSVDLAVLDGEGELLIDGHGLDVETVVLVLGLGQSDDGGLGLDGLTVSDNGVRNLEGDTSVVLLEILRRAV